MQRSEIIGLTFGYWSALSYERVPGARSALVRCRCRCGNERLIRPDHLQRGETRSCSKTCSARFSKADALRAAAPVPRHRVRSRSQFSAVEMRP